jgi:DNA-binding MarR family transcriptional regulator
MSENSDLVQAVGYPECVPDVNGLASELRLAVHRMTRRLRQQTPTEGLTLTQLSALSVVWREGPLTAGDLATKEQVRPPSITRVLTGLEALGLIRRTENPKDGRQVMVNITDEGDRRLAEYVRARELWLERALAALTEEEREVLSKASGLLDRLASQQDDEDGADEELPRRAVG